MVFSSAGVMELVDVPDSKSGVRKDVRVQVSSPAVPNSLLCRELLLF